MLIHDTITFFTKSYFRSIIDEHCKMRDTIVIRKYLHFIRRVFMKQPSRKVFMKDKGVRKGRKATKQSQSSKTDGNVINLDCGDATYRVIYNNCNAVIIHAPDNVVLGVYKAASRRWKSDTDIPITIRRSVESLYT